MRDVIFNLMKKGTIVLTISILIATIVTYYFPIICMIVGMLIGPGDSIGPGVLGIAIGEYLRPVVAIFFIIDGKGSDL